MPESVIILIVVLGVIVGISLFLVAFYFFVLRKNKIRKEFRSLDKLFQYYHALLIGQNAQYVKRLEIISRTNLLYVEIHTKFLKQFKEIRDKQDANIQTEINKMADMISDHHFKLAKKFLPELKNKLDGYEKAVSNLNNELLQVVKPEEDCRQSSLVLKEQLRRIKQDYAAKQSELAMVATSFEKVFELIDTEFENFESFVESAQYDDANNVLPKIEGILNELTNSMVDLPSLCILVSDVLPNKLSDLEHAAIKMEEDGYPLHHLCLDASIKTIREKLDNYKTRLRQFAVRGIKDELEAINNKIDDFFKKFEEEKEARKQFEEQNDSVYSTVNLIERRFIKLCNTIPEVSNIYLINNSHKTKVTEIQTDINKVGALKRSLDTFIHSTIKQPYSSLVLKMNELKDASDSIISELDEFDSYLASLKVDSEEAYKLIFDFFKKIKIAEKEVREINIPRLSEKYNECFDKSYELLNNINNLLRKTPIDVDSVNKSVSDLYDVSNDVLEGGSIAQDHNMMLLAENAIMYANKGRSHLSDIDQLVAQAETFFNEGDFEQAYIIAGNALKKIKANNERQQ